MNPARFLFAPVPMPGHTNPMLAVAAELAATARRVQRLGAGLRLPRTPTATAVRAAQPDVAVDGPSDAGAERYLAALSALPAAHDRHTVAQVDVGSGSARSSADMPVISTESVVQSKKMPSEPCFRSSEGIFLDRSQSR